MLKKIFFATGVFALLTAFIFIGCTSTGDGPLYTFHTHGETVALDKSNFSDLVDAPGRISMVEFYNPTCSPCKMMDSVVENLSVRFSGKALIGKVNVRIDDTLQYAASILRTPTFLFYNEGKETQRLVGVYKGDSLAGIIDGLLGSVAGQ